MLSIHRVVEHRARPLVALLALALAAFALVACGSSGGSGGGGSGGDAQALLRETFTGTHKIDSGKANLQLTITAQGDPSIKGPIKLGLSGPFQSAGKGQIPKFDLAVNVGFQGQAFQAGLTSTSDRVFVNFGGTAYEVPAATVAQLRQSFQRSSQKGNSSGPTLSSLGIHPLDWLKDPAVVGTDSVGGAQTQHISAQVDIGKLLDDLDSVLGKVRGQVPSAAAGAQLPAHIPPATRAQIQDAVKQANVDVWTGKDDKTLRKAAIALTVEPKSSSGSGPKSVSVSLTFEVDDLNQPQTVTAPSSARPLSELLGQVQGLFGSALGGAGSLSGGGTGSGAASTKVDAYAKCIESAGGDAQKLQDCQSLLTK